MVWVTLQAPGGQGNKTAGGGGGGGAGELIRHYPYKVTPGGTVSGNIGAGATSAAVTTSVFGTLTAQGGKGGTTTTAGQNGGGTLGAGNRHPRHPRHSSPRCVGRQLRWRNRYVRGSCGQNAEVLQAAPEVVAARATSPSVDKERSLLFRSSRESARVAVVRRRAQPEVRVGMVTA